MELIIGKQYDTSCAELKWLEDGRIYYVPIFDHFHADAQFGFPDAHYHIDARFYMHPRMAHFFKVRSGKTASIITKHCSAFDLKKVVSQNLPCVSTVTGLRLPEEGPKVDLYRIWYNNFIGKSCAGRRCPHFGTYMLEQNGKVTCPMHGLTADPHSLLIIPLTSESTAQI